MSDRKPRKGLFFNPDSGAAEPSGPANLVALEEKIGYVFRDRDILLQALTHSTYAYEHRQENLMNNERLEFLGDAVLDLVISDALFRQPEHDAEGIMTKTRALVVCENTLAQVAQSLDLGWLLLMGRGETATGGREKPSNLANAVEALFGAIYLDGGYEQVELTIRRLLREPLRQARSGDLVYDYKSRLLEWVQGTRGVSTLRFQILDESGPVHERSFTAGIFVDDQLVATGTGCSKKEAEQQAAREALDNLNCDRQGCSAGAAGDTGG